jgi:hypothetical protein
VGGRSPRGARTTCGLCRVLLQHVPKDPPIEGHSQRGEVLLDGRARMVERQLFEVGGDVVALDGRRRLTNRAGPGKEPDGIATGNPEDRLRANLPREDRGTGDRLVVWRRLESERASETLRDSMRVGAPSRRS